MSATSCDCWTARSAVERSRLQPVGQLLLLLLVLAVVCIHPLASWAKVLALVVLPVVAWLEWQGRATIVAVAYAPGELVLTLRDSSRWRADASAVRECWRGWIMVRASQGGRRRWLILFCDQLPDYHWRRLAVILRWR